MSILTKTKNFFGLGPYEMDGVREDAYYNDEPPAPRYNGNLAYAPEPDYEYQRESVELPFEISIVSVDVFSYNEAAKIGSAFRDGEAVIFDLSDMPNDIAKRVLDFSGGLAFALHGKIKRLVDEHRVFGLIPEDATVSFDDLRRAAKIY